jgi:hypothetical protein
MSASSFRERGPPTALAVALEQAGNRQDTLAFPEFTLAVTSPLFS